MSLGTCCKLLTRRIAHVVTTQATTAASSRVRFRPPYTRLHTSGKRHYTYNVYFKYICLAGLLKRDYYKILGVPRDATTKEIKKAYYEVCVY